MMLIKLHVILAGFFLPVAIVFAVTGGLYTFESKGEYKAQAITLPLDLPADPGLVALQEKAREILRDNYEQASEPTGKAGVRKVGTSWQFEWTGSRADFTLEPTAEAGTFKANYKRTNGHRFFVQLHKAKGGTLFKYLAGSLAIAFVLMFASGVMLALRNPRLKPMLYVSLGLGLITFTVAAILS